MSNEIRGRLPSVPEYYKIYIDQTVDLLSNPKQCCPFHKERTPSFSYFIEKQRWRCFGSCKKGGDVVELHRMNYHLETREAAEKSLKALHGVFEKPVLSTMKVESLIEDSDVYEGIIYQEALLLANCPERWIELDYEMSKYPFDVTDLEHLIRRWRIR